MSESNEVALRYLPEVTFGVTPPDDNGWKVLGYAGAETLNSRPQYVESNKMIGGAVSRVPRARILVSRETLGGVPFEFSAANLDDFLEAALCGTWAGDVLNVGTVDRSFSIEREYLDIPARASELLTLTGLPLNTETVTIDAKAYTFLDTLVDADGNVQIGATPKESLQNLRHAVNLTGTPGTDYAASMTAHPTADAEDQEGDIMKAIAKTGGTAGNSIATTDTLTNGGWGGATMSGGAATSWFQAKGMRVAQLDLNGVYGQPVVGNVVFAGKNAIANAGASLVGSGSESGEADNRVYQSADFSNIRFAGRPVVPADFILSELSFGLNNNMTALHGLGATDAFDQRKGRCVVTGRMRAYLSGATIDVYKRGLDGQPTQLEWTVTDGAKSYNFNFQETTLEGDSPGSPGPNSQVEVQADFYMQENGLVITRVP